MTKTTIIEGVSVVDVPEVGLSVLCGCPENIVKYLVKAAVIRQAERDGSRYETGPNAILLGEVPVQNGRFRNLAEFPILQMLYRQGMIVPAHPNNTGARPMLIGLKAQIEAQAAYIYVGNYGLDPDEVLATGMRSFKAAELERMKLKFAFGRRKRTGELLDLRVIDRDSLPLRGALSLHRSGVNQYEFVLGQESIAVSLDTTAFSVTPAPYSLPRRLASLEDFAVVHIGEGDGWDPLRPCMGSVVIHRGEAWLVDAGPDIEESLDAIGIGVGGLSGVFQTHAHDDHFIGITALFRADRRLRYFALPCVRASATKKLCALTGLREADFSRYFEVHDLKEGSWNDVDGMEVMPILSPHPVENSIMRFRSGKGRQALTYAHYADLTSFRVIDSMTTADASVPGLRPSAARRFKSEYLEPFEAKKIDAGGGMIHGEVEDFAKDASGTLFVSHTSGPVSPSVGRVAAFGELTILKVASLDYLARRAESLLRRAFASNWGEELALLSRDEPTRFEDGAVLIREGASVDSVHLLLHGVVEAVDRAGRRTRTSSPGSILGGVECVHRVPASAGYTAFGAVITTMIPAMSYRGLVSGRPDHWAVEARHDIVSFFRRLPLFLEIGSLDVLDELADGVELMKHEDGDRLSFDEPAGITIIAQGKGSMRYMGKQMVRLGVGDFCGEEAIVGEGRRLFDSSSEGNSIAYFIPAPLVEDKPALLWGLREAYGRRMAEIRGDFDLA